MSEEAKATGQNGGAGKTSEGEGNSNDISKITDSINVIKDVMGDLVTKVSDIERSTQESRDYEAIMRNIGNEEEVKTPPQNVQTQDGVKKLDDMSNTELANHIAQSLGNNFQGQFDGVTKSIRDLGATFEVKDLSRTEPNFEKEIRPLAFQISKRPGMEGLSPTALSNIAKGELALRTNKSLSDENVKLKNDMSNMSAGDKPGFFVGMEEPPKEMDMDESFNDAWKKAALEREGG